MKSSTRIESSHPLDSHYRGMCRDDTHQQARRHTSTDYTVGLYNVMRRAAHAESGIQEIILADAVESSTHDRQSELFL